MSAGAATGAAPARFEPPVGAESGPFWEATREGRLLVQWCTACDRGVFYPRVVLPALLRSRRAGARSSGATPAGGRPSTPPGSSTGPRPPAPTSPAAQPYCVALVDLEEGVRMLTNVVGCPPDDVRSGMAVTRDVGAAERRPAAAALRAGRRGRERGHEPARDKRAAAAQGMLHAWWAARIPDRLASSPRTATAPTRTSTPTSTGWPGRCGPAGCRPGDAIALMCTNRPEFLEVALRRPAHRPAPHADQLAPHRRGGRLHRRELRGQGVRLLGRARASRSSVAAEGGGPGLVKINTGGYLPGFEMYNAVVAEEDGSDIDDPVHGHPDALHVGHDRAAQGRAPPTRRGRARWPPSTSAATTRTGRPASTPTC